MGDKQEIIANSDIKDKEIKAETEVVETTEKGSVIEAKADKLQGLKVLGKIDLSNDNSGKKKPKQVASSDEKKSKGKRKRKRVRIQDPERQERKQQQEKLKKEVQQQEQTKKQHRGK